MSAVLLFLLLTEISQKVNFIDAKKAYFINNFRIETRVEHRYMIK